MAIAGHRTTHGAPFRNIDQLDPGDSIEVEMPYGTFYYRVERTRIVDPTALWVKDKVGYNRLILSACHPLYSAAQRGRVRALRAPHPGHGPGGLEPEGRRARVREGDLGAFDGFLRVLQVRAVPWLEEQHEQHQQGHRYDDDGQPVRRLSGGVCGASRS